MRNQRFSKDIRAINFRFRKEDPQKVDKVYGKATFIKVNQLRYDSLSQEYVINDGYLLIQKVNKKSSNAILSVNN